MNVVMYLDNRKEDDGKPLRSKGQVTIELRGDSKMIREAEDKLKELGYEIE